MQDLAEATTGNRDKLVADLKTLAADAEALMRTTAAYSGEGVAVARQRLADNVSRVKDGLSTAQGYAMDTYRDASAAADAYVRDKPWQAVAIAAAVGFAVGILGSRR